MSGQPTQPTRRYMWRIGMAMAIYLASLFLANYLIDDRGMTGAPAFAFALVPGLAFASVIWIIGRHIVEETDEFLRMLMVRQSLIATGISFSLAAIWGFLEDFALVAHADAYWWSFWWCMGMGVGAVANRITHGTWGNCW